MAEEKHEHKHYHFHLWPKIGNDGWAVIAICICIAVCWVFG